MKNLEVLCSIQDALLGRVTPNLRAVYVYEKDQVIHLDFYYDLPPSEDEEEFVSLAVTYFIADFPDDKIEEEVFVVPYPKKVPIHPGLGAYRRYEVDTLSDGSMIFQPSKSMLEHPDPQQLLKDYAGTGIRVRGEPGDPGYQETVNFNVYIGYHVDEQTETKTPTTWGNIYYSKKGAYVVPTLPRSKE